jgi:mannitol/fructose-specific phosphotransferase system IIA component (Ntr-type)
VKLTRFIGAGGILTGVECSSKEELFGKLVKAIVSADFLDINKDLSEQQVLDAVLEREAQRSTAMGCDLAFPHARLAGLKTPALAIATLKEPLLYDDLNHVGIACMMLTPLEQPTLSLKVMAQLSRLFMKESARQEVLALTEPGALRKKIEAESLSVDVPVSARDIMRAPRWSVRPDTPLREVAHLMFSERLDVVPVVDEKLRVVGDITTSRLFRFGLPEFFTKLKSVSFIAEFDPFEKYFEAESGASARDVMAAANIVGPDHTILEVVFDLAVRKAPKLYVQDEKQRWIGVVDHSTVLDNVINF